MATKQTDPNPMSQVRFLLFPPPQYPEIHWGDLVHSSTFEEYRRSMSAPERLQSTLHDAGQQLESALLGGMGRDGNCSRIHLHRPHPLDPTPRVVPAFCSQACGAWCRSKSVVQPLLALVMTCRPIWIPRLEKSKAGGNWRPEGLP